MENVHAMILLKVTNVLSAAKRPLTIQTAKVCLALIIWKVNLGCTYSQSCFSDCKCNPNGSTSMSCDNKGDCTCKSGFTGNKCDECIAGLGGDNCNECALGSFSYPDCQGNYFNIFELYNTINFYYGNNTMF